ncbi:hypothetical protein FB192DRAFT_1283522 [Mucor lusitanicus]|uniref:Kinesin motor domain-containing protein n=1 Tax=Mucor circinelloides f. lusitanicus TaxID=29924 RepID=A0A8H4BFE4_MUCCL|nr:hypothetical protein FB192DRAFT_1283522 [Mucor lusitanicus]
MSGNIKVVVRCRPLNAREKARGATCLIRMDGNQTIITNNKAPSTNAIHQKKKHSTKDEDDNVKAFTFDRSYWSADKNDDQYADQELVYNDLGRELLDHAFDGYNCCIFAYGQTGSGKSYSMGIIPRTCSELFERIADLTSDVLKFQVEVSYIEIYNEKVRDLLNPGNKGNLKARTVAATNMNETSSRSHAVFTLFLTSNRFEQVANLNTEKAARISLVDLAGSERANSTGATGARLKEGANINKSLTTLGKVIAALAEQSSQPNHHKKPSAAAAHIPYRDSVLTWLLKDSLGGNSKTAMIAAISPADYDETLSTLRYADQAKRIKNKAIVNEDPNARLIRELKEELQALRDTLMIYAPEEVEKITLQKKSSTSGRGSRASSRATAARTTTASPMLLISPESPLVKQRGNSLLTKEQVIDQLQSSEKLLSQVNQTWEEKMSATEAIHKEREKALEELGVIVEKNNIGVYAPKTIHLINLNEDPLMTECLMYQIKPGITRVGRLGSAVPADIRLSGSEILDEHCYFENVSVPAGDSPPLHQDDPGNDDDDDDENDQDTIASNIVTIHPGKESVTLVNGMRILQPKVLHSGYRIIFGSGLHHLFRFNNPDEVRREREHMQQFGVAYHHLPADRVVDWNFAHSEALRKFGGGPQSADLTIMTDEDLKQLSDGITKADELNRERDELAAKYAQVKQDMEKVLEQQKLAYESKIKRISAHLPPGTALSSDNLLVGYTAKNAAESLMRMAVEKWRQLRYVKMAEDCLIHAVVLKEANIMAKELGKNVVYQFIVVHDDISSNPLSFWESTSALQPFMREPDTHLTKEAKPCLAVQVIDHVHRATYIWSIAKVKHRLRRMRRLYDYTDRPLFTGQHFNREDPFYETPCPRFSLIGLARVPLRNLTLQLHADNYVAIYCRNTGKVMGHIRVLITPIARSVSRKHQHPNTSSDQKQVLGEKYLLHIGQQQVFEIRIQELKGVRESDFTQVHAQFRLSSFGNVERYSTADKIYQTDPISNFGTDTVQFNQCQTLSVNITENMMDVILNQGLTIEVYGQAQEDYLFGLVEHVSSASATGSVPASRRFSIDRRFSVEQSTYDGILMEEKHDVLAWIQICELNDDGEYAPVKVLHTEHHQDVFCLRQGLQRRIALTLSHDSGKQFEWLGIKQAKIGNVRLVDNKGRQTDSPPHPPVEIHLFPDQQATTFERNGKSRMTAQGPWDSSLHDSLFLNRVTAPGQRVRLRLSWQIECEKCAAPLNFEMDISVQIQARDATVSTSASSSSMFRQFLLGGGDADANGRVSKIVHKTSGLFVVQLKPPMTRQVRELWRLNTANKYVRGEEFIGSWKPRGVSLITDYRAARQRMLHQESVAAFRHSLVLAGHPQTKVIQRSQSDHALTLQCHMTDLTTAPTTSESSNKQKTEPEALARKVIELWQSHFGTREEVLLLYIQYMKCRTRH